MGGRCAAGRRARERVPAGCPLHRGNSRAFPDRPCRGYLPAGRRRRAARCPCTACRTTGALRRRRRRAPEAGTIPTRPAHGRPASGARGGWQRCSSGFLWRIPPPRGRPEPQKPVARHATRRRADAGRCSRGQGCVPPGSRSGGAREISACGVNVWNACPWFPCVARAWSTCRPSCPCLPCCRCSAFCPYPHAPGWAAGVRGRH